MSKSETQEQLKEFQLFVVEIKGAKLLAKTLTWREALEDLGISSYGLSSFTNNSLHRHNSSSSYKKATLTVLIPQTKCLDTGKVYAEPA